jgi:uncharacterized protein
MPRKYFKKYLPSPASISENRFMRVFAPWLRHHNLWHLHRRSVAGGVAIGLVTGLIPGPVQMLASAIFAILFRVNLPVAVLTTFYTNPFTFIPLYVLAYHIGALATGEKTGELNAPEFHWDWSHFTQLLPELIRWMSSLGHTLLIGLIIQCIVFALVGYFAVRGLWRLWVVRQWRGRHKGARAKLSTTVPGKPHQ